MNRVTKLWVLLGVMVVGCGGGDETPGVRATGGGPSTAGGGGASGSTSQTGGTGEVDAGSGGTVQAGGSGGNGGSAGATGMGGQSVGGGGASSGGAPVGGIASGGLSTGGIASGGVSTGGIASGGVSTGGIASGGVPTGGIASGGLPTGGIASGGVSTGGTPSGGVSTGGAPSGGVPTGGTPSGGLPTGGIASGGVSTGGIASGGVPIGGTPSGGVPIGGIPSGGVPTGGTPSGGVPTGGTPSGGVPIGGIPSGGASQGGTSSGGASTGGASDGGVSTGGAAGASGAGGTSCQSTTPAVPAHNPCDGVMCQPGARGQCVDATTYRGAAGPGLCLNGQCLFDPIDTACASCEGSTCTGSGTCADGCTSPPAPTCTSALDLVTYAPVGTCAAGSCTYPPRTTRCSNGCLNGACLAASTLRETIPLANPSSTSRTLRMVLDEYNQPHLVECTGSVIRYWRRTTSGFASIDVDSQIGSACDFSLAVSGGKAFIAYRVSSTPQLRLATQTSATGFTLDVVSLGSTQSPSVTVDAGTPVVAFAKADVSPYEVRVARPGGVPWTSQPIFTYTTSFTTPVVQILAGPDHRLHVVLGEGASSRTTAYPAATYAMSSESGWTVQNNVILNAYLSRKPMVLDGSGNAVVFAQAYATAALSYSGPTNIEFVYRFPATGPADREAVRSFTGWTPALAARYWDGTVGSLTVAGALTRRVARDYWRTAGSAKTATDIAVGSDGGVRTIGYDSATYTWYFLTEPCPKYCAGACGSDGCGGSCGECGGCDQCDPELAICSDFRSERLDRYNTRPTSAVVLPDNRWLVALAPDQSLLGTTGQWSPGPSTTGGFYPSPNGEHVYEIYTYGGIRKWNGTAFESVYGTTPANSRFAVDNAGTLHVLRVNPSDDSQVIYQTLIGTGLSTPEVVYDYDSGTVGAHSVIADQDGTVHAFYNTQLYDWMGGTTTTYYAVKRPGGAFTSSNFGTGSVLSMIFDPARTLWAESSDCYMQWFYSYKPLDQGWVKYTANCTSGSYTQRAYPGPGQFLVAPDGRIQRLYSSGTLGIYEINATTRNFALVRSFPTQMTIAGYDRTGRLHGFGQDSSSGILHFRHFYQP